MLPKQEFEWGWEEWLNHFASTYGDDIFALWLENKYKFACQFLIIEEDKRLWVADKKTYKCIELPKTKEEFRIDIRPQEKSKKVTLFKLGQFEVTKNVRG